MYPTKPVMTTAATIRFTLIVLLRSASIVEFTVTRGRQRPKADPGLGCLLSKADSDHFVPGHAYSNLRLNTSQTPISCFSSLYRPTGTSRHRFSSKLIRYLS